MISAAEARSVRAGLRQVFERFEAFAKKLVNVPKKEIDEKQKEWERKQAKRPKRA